MEELRKKIVNMGKILVRENLTHGTCGNISSRYGDKVLITPSNLSYEEMEPEDILLIDMEGNVVEGERNPSVETPLHISIYKSRKDVNAIIHTHSEYALAVSSIAESIPIFLDEIFSYVGGELKVAKYALPGSEELAENVREALGDNDAVLLANHGVIACGKDLDEALEVARNIERICRIFAIASSMGRIRELPEEGKDYQRMMFEMRKEL